MMLVKGLRLPVPYEQLVCQEDVPMEWELTQCHDAYGSFWNTYFELWTDPDGMELWTDLIPELFRISHMSEEEIRERNTESANYPGFIPFITDFSRIVQFGQNGAGSQFSFDFREEQDEPSVIFWEGFYWRRVAPNFKACIGLFKPSDWSEQIGRLTERERQRLYEEMRRYGIDGDPSTP